jgi:hypothetical protein
MGGNQYDLNYVILCNKKVMINILFRSVSETLLQFGQNPENGFGGKLGFMTFLHTWDQKILDHFHIHCTIPAGALCKSGKKWIDCNYDFLFSEQAYKKKELIFPGKTKELVRSDNFYQLKTLLWSKNWE